MRHCGVAVLAKGDECLILTVKTRQLIMSKTINVGAIVKGMYNTKLKFSQGG